jgi:hypothetical protein
LIRSCSQIADISRASLANWYLEEISDDIPDEESLSQHSSQIRKIIRRLIEVDHVLIESEKDVLQVHPNYDMSNARPMSHID